MRGPRLTVLLLAGAGALAAPQAQAATPPPTVRWVQATSLMLRAEPSAQARILERLPQGHRVDLSRPPAAGAEWCEVQGAGPLRYTGYVACRYLSEQPVAPLKAGDPIFLSHALEVERFAADAPTLPDTEAGCACTVYPFFIGEAAYYERGKDMAFMLARKETLRLKVCVPCVTPPSSTAGAAAVQQQQQQQAADEPAKRQKVAGGSGT